MGMREIRYHGRTLAFTAGTDILFSPELRQLAEGHPLRRWAVALARFGIQVDAGQQPAPYDPERAELFARGRLMPFRLFLEVAERSDGELADWFGVPIEQVALRRSDLEVAADGARRDPRGR